MFTMEIKTLFNKQQFTDSTIRDAGKKLAEETDLNGLFYKILGYDEEGDKIIESKILSKNDLPKALNQLVDRTEMIHCLLCPLFLICTPFLTE